MQESNKKSPRDKSAGMEYKTVMAQLKHPNRPNTFEEDTFDGVNCGTGSSISLKTRRGALLSDDEIDDNDWLIDDLGPERKKRRFHTPMKEIASTSKENIHTDSMSSTWCADDALLPDNAFQVLLDAATASTKQQRKKQTTKLRLSGSSNVSNCSNLSIGRGKTKQQSSLLENGFCRFRSESPRSGDDSFDLPPTTNEPDSTTASLHLLISPSKSSPIKVQATQVIPATISFKIKVENELLLVPVERKKLNDINIRWLAEESARRYYKFVV